MIDVSKVASGLVLGTDGIWYGDTSEVVSYPSDGNQACFLLEDSSFWFKHRNACISAAVTAFPPKENGPIFDIGGGNGFVSVGLMKAGFEVGLVEPGPEGAANAKKRGVPTVICATIASAGFRSASLEAVGLFDVIEHVNEDVCFLESIRSLVKKGGRLYATVPAYSTLWSNEDRVAGHFRRYTRKEIGDKIERAGFKLDYATYIFKPLPLPILLFRSLPYRLGHRGSPDRNGGADHHRPGNSMASRMLRWVLDGETAKIASKEPIAFGGSCLLVASAA